MLLRERYRYRTHADLGRFEDVVLIISQPFLQARAPARGGLAYFARERAPQSRERRERSEAPAAWRGPRGAPFALENGKTFEAFWVTRCPSTTAL